MQERNRKLIDTKIFDGKYKRELLEREIQRPDELWVLTWFGWTYMFINNEWVQTPEAPMFTKLEDGEAWITSSI